MVGAFFMQRLGRLLLRKASGAEVARASGDTDDRPLPIYGEPRPSDHVGLSIHLGVIKTLMPVRVTDRTVVDWDSDNEIAGVNVGHTRLTQQNNVDGLAGMIVNGTPTPWL